MNLSDIFKTQIDLDRAIWENVVEEEKENHHIKATIALIVELSEFANEVKAFKYWKKDKHINRTLMLEEFADGIHFLTSFANDFQIDPEIQLIFQDHNFCLQLAYTYICFTKLLNDYTKQNVIEAYGAYLALGALVDITYDDILKAYRNKNQINYQRIKDNY
ncbi:dUTP diphosphatase [[Mycoplasma] anseris]|uniref:dUTPase n=1 Tax=[Mycoplasma] anseris TaxID=92400 RepID=A0A2Z4NDL7_9BACT|nr:dUTP diphosphatase [[Mycoplasma] anseris]AWX69650.1 hypothetical protein DP065_02760 [[Mycoplasma] anseris]